MGQVSKGEGRTILFVSHNMAAVSQLCTKAILLKNGQIETTGTTAKVLDDYLRTDLSLKENVDFTTSLLNRIGNQKVTFQSAVIKDKYHLPAGRFAIGDSIYISFSLKFFNPNQNSVRTSIELKTIDGIKLANMLDADSAFEVKSIPGETNTYEVTINDVRLYPGSYYLSLYAGDIYSIETYDYIEDCLSFEIVDGGLLTSRALPRAAGLMFFTPHWRFVETKSKI